MEKIENESEINLIEIFHTILKNKKFIIIFNIIIVILVLLFSIISLVLPNDISYLPNEFTAISIVKLKNNSSSNGISTMLNNSGLNAVAGLMGVKDTGNSNASWAIEMGRSRTVIDEISAEFNLTHRYAEGSKNKVYDTRKIILENLLIEESEDTGALVIQYTDIDKNLCTSIVNKIVEILENFFNQLDEEYNMWDSDILLKQLEAKENEIRVLTSDLTDFQAKYNIVDPYVMAEEITKKIMELRTTVNKLQSELEFMKSNFSLNSPEIFKKELELESTKKILSDIEQGKGDASMPSLSEIPHILVEYQEKKTYIEAQVKIYTGLMQQYELLRLKQNGTSPTFQVIEKAEIPLMKSGPSRGKICILVSFIGFFLSIILCFVKDFISSIKIEYKNHTESRGK